MPKIETQEVTKQGLASIRQTVGVLATAEGLPGHKQSIEIRFQ